jgi:hypothetical protein
MALTAAEPQVGDVFDPVTISLTKRLVDDYVNATGDTTFAAHAASMKLVTGLDIAPPTVFDRDMGSRLSQQLHLNGYSLHAKQEFTFMRPLQQGVEYTITGTVTNVYSKNGADYFTFQSECCSADGEVAMRTLKTSAFRFPGNKYLERPERHQPTLQSFLADSRANDGTVFPAVGSIVEGSPLHLTRDLMNLYSGPQSGHHTNAHVARVKGHKDSIVQGLSISAHESTLYREVFGLSWYTGGRMSVAYIKPILANSMLIPVGVVMEHVGDQFTVRTAIFDQDLEVVTIGTVVVDLT